ncbi:MAG: hypothetical protein RLZZ450_7361 [Pseudomonadota bacterium]
MLAVALAGCAGDVVEGLPLDGGDDVPVSTDNAPVEGTSNPDAKAPPAAVATDAGAASGARDAGSVRDAGAPTVSTPGPATPSGASDAAAPSAAAPDAGPPSSPGARDYSTDRAKFVGAPRCDKAGALFCDDFEGQAAGSQPGPAWSYPFGYKPVIDETRAARGKKSLHFSIASGMPAQIEEKQTFPAAGNSFYGRMFVWLGALPTSASMARYTLVGGRGTGSGNEVRLEGMYLSATKQNHFGIGSDGPLADTDGDGKDDDDWHIDGKESQSITRANDWTCLEWQFKGDSSETRVWIDGVEQTSLHTTSDAYYNGGKYSNRSFVHPTFDALRIGWWVYQSDAMPSPFDLWIDEVAVDKARIGCVY